MNPSTFLPTSPTRYPFIPPSTFYLRRRYKISTIRSAASTPKQDDDHVLAKNLPVFEVMMSPPIRIATSAIVAAAAVASGYGLGTRFGGSCAAYVFISRVNEVAAADTLRDYVTACSDPKDVNKDHLVAIANKYGVSKHNEVFTAELCDIYSQYVSTVLPHGNEDLKGNEVETIIQLKNSLGIDDPEAANVHMEIARRIFRLRLETGDRDSVLEQLRAFQKLIYVSNLVFGEAAGFLLPWKRMFKVTDSQVEVAVRDNAQRLYGSKLYSVSQDVDASQLISLRDAQLMYRLSDKLAADMFRDHTRKLVEQNLSAAVSLLKSRSRSVRHVIEDLDKILAFNNLLISLKSHPDANRFARGVGPVSLIEKPKGRPITKVCRVFVACAFNISRPIPLDDRELHRKDDAERFTRTRFLRCLEKASIKENKDQVPSSRSWRVCTVGEVEEAKIAVRMVPMWMTFIVVGVVSSIGNTYFMEQANHMNRNLGKWTVPLPIFKFLFDYAKDLFGAIADRLLKPESPYKSSGGLAVAMVFSVLCCITAAKIENRRIHVIIRHNLLDKPDDDIPMNMFWLLFQFFLLGGMDSLFEKSVAAFYANQAPDSMDTSYLSYFSQGVSGLGYLSSVLLVYVVGKVSERGGKMNWFQYTLNRSRLDRYYWFLAALSAVNMIIFILVALFYRYKVWSGVGRPDVNAEVEALPQEDNNDDNGAGS